MLDLNVRAVHILTKLFLADFRERDSGYILNVLQRNHWQMQKTQQRADKNQKRKYCKNQVIRQSGGTFADLICEKPFCGQL